MWYSVCANRDRSTELVSCMVQLPTFIVVAWCEDEARQKAKDIIGPDLIEDSLSVVEMASCLRCAEDREGERV